jgi:hypothetical protein
MELFNNQRKTYIEIAKITTKEYCKKDAGMRQVRRNGLGIKPAPTNKKAAVSGSLSR